MELKKKSERKTETDSVSDLCKLLSCTSSQFMLFQYTDDLIIEKLEIKNEPGSYYICALNKKEFLDSKPAIPIVGIRYEIHVVESLKCAADTDEPLLTPKSTEVTTF